MTVTSDAPRVSTSPPSTPRVRLLNPRSWDAWPSGLAVGARVIRIIRAVRRRADRFRLALLTLVLFLPLLATAVLGGR